MRRKSRAGHRGAHAAPAGAGAGDDAGSRGVKVSAVLPETALVKARLHHRVYVVRLAHPRCKGREAFYVGMTGLPITERFANHKRGYKSAHVVHRYGIELAPEWYQGIPAMSYGEAALTEPELADELRDRGFLVFGPTNRPPKRKRRARRRR
jgi:hypothetical protein